MPLAVSQDCGHGHDVFVDYFRCPETFGVLRTRHRSRPQSRDTLRLATPWRLGVYTAIASLKRSLQLDRRFSDADEARRVLQELGAS
jgi:hypothetical protein